MARHLVIAALALGFACRAGAEAGPRPGVFRRKLVAPDGVALALYRYVPEAAASAAPPVLLVPDLGMTHEIYDLGGQGLAPYLRARGREVFVLEFRGHGASQAPEGWGLDDVGSKDLVAAVDVIRKERPGSVVDAVVLGWGGALFLGAAATDLAGKVGRIVALSTPVHPSVPNPTARKVLRAGGRFRTLGGTFAGGRELDLLFTLGGQFHAGRVGALREALVDLGERPSRELLSWFEAGDLVHKDGTTLRGRLAGLRGPVLVVLPLGDNWAHPEFASVLQKEAPHAEVSFRLLSRVERCEEDYTHLSMVQGKEADRDVFDPALAFLAGRQP